MNIKGNNLNGAVSQEALAQLSKDIALGKVEAVYIGYTDKDGNQKYSYSTGSKSGTTEIIGMLETIKLSIALNSNLNIIGGEKRNG